MSKRLHTCMYKKTVWFFEEFESLLESVCTQVKDEEIIAYDITLRETGFFKTTYHFWMRGTKKQLRQAEKELGV